MNADIFKNNKFNKEIPYASDQVPAITPLGSAAFLNVSQVLQKKIIVEVETIEKKEAVLLGETGVLTPEEQSAVVSVNQELLFTAGDTTYAITVDKPLAADKNIYFTIKNLKKNSISNTGNHPSDAGFVPYTLDNGKKILLKLSVEDLDAGLFNVMIKMG